MAQMQVNIPSPTTGLGRFMRSRRLCRMSGPAAAGKPNIEIPEMIPIPGMPDKRIMKGELTADLFKQVMEGYEIFGHNAASLKDLLADDSKAGASLTYVSLVDAREFARRLSKQTGRRFRVQTEAEWEAAAIRQSSAGDRLSGGNMTWTDTPYSGDSRRGMYVLRELYVAGPKGDNPNFRFSNCAIRLIEEL